MRICPYCNEQIPDEALICPICGEKLVSSINIDKVKKIVIWSSVIIVLLGLGFAIFKGVSTVIKNNSLVEVQELNMELQSVDYLQMMVRDETVLMKKLKNAQDKSKNDKHFAIFYKNLLKYRRAFVDNSYSPSMSIEEYLGTQGIKLSQSGRMQMSFTNPKTQIIYYEYSEASRGFGINNNYLKIKYGHYLSDAYNEFLNLLHQENNDRTESAYNDDMWSFYRRWNKKWTDFTSKYPSFELNEIIIETINTYSSYI